LVRDEEDYQGDKPLAFPAFLYIFTELMQCILDGQEIAAFPDKSVA